MKLLIFDVLFMSCIEVKNVSKSFWSNFRTTKVLDNVSFEVEKGSVFGFLGPNGAGKTTTIKMLLGLLRPDTGSVVVNKENPSSIRVKESIGFLPEDPYFYQYLTGEEFLRFCGSLFAMDDQKLEKKIDELFPLVKLEEHRKKLLRHYSKGMLQRIGIAQSLINDPKLVFFDEPLSGLDPIGRKDIKEIILNLKKAKKTLFINSHILSDIEELCDDIAILHKGKILQQGRMKDLVKKGNLENYFVKTIQNADK